MTVLLRSATGRCLVWIAMATALLSLAACRHSPDSQTLNSAVASADQAAMPFISDHFEPGRYRSVRVSPCVASMRTNWLADHNAMRTRPMRRLTASDLQAVERRVGEQCDRVFDEALAGLSSLTFVRVDSESPASTLIFQPRVIDLDVAAPDTLDPQVFRVYVPQSTEMVLVVDAIDAATGERQFTWEKNLFDLDSLESGVPLRWASGTSNKRDTAQILARGTSHFVATVGRLGGGLTGAATDTTSNQ